MISNRREGGGGAVEQVGAGSEAGFVIHYCTSLKEHILKLKGDEKNRGDV